MTAPDPVAYFNNWQFSTNKTKFECPGMDTAACKPPGNACARDPNTGQQYCCDGPPDTGRVCWGFESPCKSDGSTINCTDGKRKFCCRSGFEKCSETPNQAAGICWSTHHDPLNNVTFSHLSSVHSSLNASRPSATSLPFDLFSIVSATATAPFATTSGPAQTSTSAGGTSTPPPGAPAEGSSAVSGGAIAGIVIGAVAGIALIGVAVFFLLRRRRRAAHAYEAPPEGSAAGPSEKHGNDPSGPVEAPASPTTAGYDGSLYGKPGAKPGLYNHHHQQPPPQELGSDAGARSELPGEAPSELPASPVPTAGVSTMTTPPSQYYPSPFTDTRSPAS
ncbi:hypothetical protein MAPG_10096 [Magnaporthiopsis poae ATCC 64411]|uniref:Mid2 domain-containing protein n=1 Tax=Magnaporthiopsis poae (strain ATCC 64411 / 73-15) TaxID=644358 RepID=A0A0C4EBP2_MAGP6|nr:hypothetical protein MAPG_10096 [Magnaporthiopsis poae ATCC 64411]